jgi:hypothetical protein
VQLGLPPTLFGFLHVGQGVGKSLMRLIGRAVHPQASASSAR